MMKIAGDDFYAEIKNLAKAIRRQREENKNGSSQDKDRE